MTTFELYCKHKKGEISREKFLYEVRRDNNLPWITNLTSYNDAITILKNKGIVTEASLKSLIAPLTSKLESMGYDVDYDFSFGFMALEAFKTLPDGSVLRMYLRPSDKELQQKNYSGRSEDFSTIDVSFTHWTTKVTNKLFGLYKQKTQVMNNLPDEEGNNIDLGTGMFDIPIEQSVDRVVDLVKKAEAKVSNTSLNEVDTKEAKKDEAVKAEVKAKAPSKKQPKELHIDHANPYEYRHGIAYELDCLDDYSAESLEKAKEKVLKNLAKDANFYSTLLNQKQSSFEFKKTETDAKGMQAKADGYLKKELKKDEKANVQDSLGKKEEGSKKPKGVKIMPDKGVTGSEKTIKEGLEEAFNLNTAFKTSPSSHSYNDVLDIFTSYEDENILNAFKAKFPEDKDISKIDYLKFAMNYIDDMSASSDIMANWISVTDPDIFDKAGLVEITPGVNLGASFDKLKGGMNAEDEFESLVKKYDWYAEMSDDPRKWNAQQSMEADLRQLSKTIGVDKAVEIFNRYAPSDRKVTSSDTMWSMNEDKHAKIKEALKKALKEADPTLTKLSKDEETAEKNLATILKKKADILNKPGTQG